MLVRSITSVNAATCREIRVCHPTARSWLDAVQCHVLVIGLCGQIRPGATALATQISSVTSPSAIGSPGVLLPVTGTSTGVTVDTPHAPSVLSISVWFQPPLTLRKLCFEGSAGQIRTSQKFSATGYFPCLGVREGEPIEYS